MYGEFFPLTEKEARKKGVDNTSGRKYNSGFATRLRELRGSKGKGKGSGFDQGSVASKIGVTKSSLSLYENGENVPDARTIRKMAEFYGVSADYLLGLSDAKTNDKDIQFVSEYLDMTAESVSCLHTLSSFGFAQALFDFAFSNAEYNYIPPEDSEDLSFFERLDNYLWAALNTAQAPPLNPDTSHPAFLHPELILLLQSKQDELAKDDALSKAIRSIPPGMTLISENDANAFFKEQAKKMLCKIVEDFIDRFDSFIQSKEADHAEE